MTELLTQPIGGSESSGVPDLYGQFCSMSFAELEAHLVSAETRDAKAFYRALLNLRLQIEQERVVGEELL